MSAKELIVAKPFSTRLQRFKPGAKIPAGTDLSPHTAESLKAAGAIEDPDAKAGAKPVAGGKRG